MILFCLPEAATDDGLRAENVGWALRELQTLAEPLPPSIASRLGFKVGAHSG